MPQTTFKLNTGADIPAIGLGTWRSEPGQVATAVEHALKSGYRHLDCAFAYANEEEVGAGIRKSGVKREDIFITSKLWCTYHDRVQECLDLTLQRLGVDYLDLYLVHWPARTVKNGTSELFPVTETGARNVDWDWDQADTWRQMEALLQTGKVKAIGVSNFSEILLERLSKTWQVVPAVNQYEPDELELMAQVELHPFNPQHGLKKYCDDRGILLQAYSPLGSQAVAAVLISWAVIRGTIVLPKSVSPSQSNLQTVELDADDMKTLDGLAASGKQLRTNTPNWQTDFGFADWYGPGNRDAPADARLLADCACKASARETSGRHPARVFIAGGGMVMIGS